MLISQTVEVLIVSTFTFSRPSALLMGKGEDLHIDETDDVSVLLTSAHLEVILETVAAKRCWVYGRRIFQDDFVSLH